MSAICDAHEKVVVELLYNSVHRKFNELEIRCGRENQHPAVWAPRPSIEQIRRTRLRTGRVFFRGSLRPDKFARYGRRMRWGCRGKSQNRKKVYLSPYVEKTLNSKVIKMFRNWTKKSLRVFRVSGFLCSMLYIRTFYVRFTYSYHGYRTHIVILITLSK